MFNDCCSCYLAFLETVLNAAVLLHAISAASSSMLRVCRQFPALHLTFVSTSHPLLFLGLLFSVYKLLIQLVFKPVYVNLSSKKWPKFPILSYLGNIYMWLNSTKYVWYTLYKFNSSKIVLLYKPKHLLLAQSVALPKISWMTTYLCIIKGVLHPRPLLWLFVPISQKLQHIGDK